MYCFRTAVSVVLALVANSAIAEGKTYLGIVGELLGTTVTPNVVSEFCTERHLDRGTEFHDLYVSWRNRHAQVFAAIDEELERANAILVRQGAPGGDFPVRAATDAISAALKKQFESISPSQAQALCDGYFQLLETKDEEFAATATELLTQAKKLDSELSR